MFTGYKMLPSSHAGSRVAGVGLALVVLAVAAAFAWFVITYKWK